MTNNEIVVRALANTGITALNEMQQAVLDAGTTKDMVLLSPTGSGKTLAFLLPLLTTLTDEDKKIQAVIIAPSRELALQIETVLRSLGAGYKVNCCYGGHPIRTEKKSLEHPPTVLIGTPGRIVDHLERGNINLDSVRTLILDEFDKSSAKQMPLLKSLMQMADLNLCKAYQKNFRNLPRIASFIGTSNRFDLLSDTTGSRRFLCVEVKDKIDCSHIEHKQIYAQLKQELADGARYWFTAEEEQELQEHNLAFRHHNPADEVLHSCFRPATAEDSKEEVIHLSAADIFKELKRQNPAAMRGTNPNSFSQRLVPAGFVRKHGRYGNFYPVVPLA